MQNKTIVIAGGSGFIGQGLIRYFDPSNQIYVLGRKTVMDPGTNVRHLVWNGKDPGPWSRVLEGADLVINLCGKSVNCRYTFVNKKEIFDSRTDTTQALGAAIRACKKPPLLFINAASATIYRHAEDRPQDEYTGELGNGFSVAVCRKWEDTFLNMPMPGIRRVVLRMAIVLGEGSVMDRLHHLVRWRLGGSMGSGRQMMSWVHMEDVARMIEFIDRDETMEGIYNCSAPGPVTNREFMQALRRSDGVRLGLPTPGWALALGARLIGTEPELILKSRWVLPTRVQESGFSFLYPDLSGALNQLTHR